MSKNQNYLFKKKDYLFFFIIFLLNCFVAIFEFLSLGSIPLLVSTIFDPQSSFKYSIDLFQFDKKSLNKNNILIFISIIVFFIFLLKNIVLLFTIYFEQSFYKNLNTRLSSQLLNSYLNINYENHLVYSSNKLINTIFNEANYAIYYLSNLNQLYRDALIFLVIFVLISIVNLKVTLFITLFLAVSVFIFLKVLKPIIKKKSLEHIKLREEIIQIIGESFNSLKEIKLFKKIKSINLLSTKKILKYHSNTLAFTMINKFPRIILEILSIFCLVTFIFFIFDLNRLDKSFSLLSLVAITFIRFIPAFNSFTTSLNGLRQFKPSFEKVLNELNEFEKNKIKKNIFFKNIYEWNKSNLFLEIKSLTFAYANSSKKILDNYNFNLKFGETLGVGGKSGSGKTTFLNLILGLLKPNSGKIILCEKFNLENLISNYLTVGYVSQNVFLLNDTIKKNITFNIENEIVDEILLKKVIEIVELQDIINEMKQGLNTIIGEQSIKISGGQKQRIALARALYQNPKLLVLDEATNALDEKSETSILNNIKNFMEKKNLIIVSHKKEVLKNCNKIINF